MEFDSEWRVEQSMYRDSVDFLLLHHRGGQTTSGQRTEFVLVPSEEGLILEPTFSVTRQEAQQIINGLWRSGFRPKDGSGAIAHVEAIEGHLQDMRKIAFNRLKIDEAS